MWSYTIGCLEWHRLSSWDCYVVYYVCRVVEGTHCNASTHLRLNIEVCCGLEKILKFDNFEPRFTLGGLGCIRCGHVRSGSTKKIGPMNCSIGMQNIWMGLCWKYCEEMGSVLFLVSLTRNIHYFMGIFYEVIFSDGLVCVTACSFYIYGMYVRCRDG